MATQPRKVLRPKKKGGRVFSRYYKHWRTGKVYDAWDYGHKAWPIGG